MSDEHHAVTFAALIEICDVSKSHGEKLISAGIFARCAPGLFDLEASLSAYIKMLKSAAKTASADPKSSALIELSLLRKVQRELLESKRDHFGQQTIPVEQHQRDVGIITTAIGNAIATASDVIMAKLTRALPEFGASTHRLDHRHAAWPA
jgi:hypothetical protein